MIGRLTMLAWRMSRYLAESEAGTNMTPESLCQARMLRIGMDSAAHCYAEALTLMASANTPIPEALIDNGRRLAALASISIPTFPDDLNTTAYRFEIDAKAIFPPAPRNTA